MSERSSTARDGDGPRGSRLMLVLAEGCRVGVALDSVEGVFDLARSGDETLPADSATGRPTISLSQITGVAAPSGHPPPRHLLVVRTGVGPMALAIDSCLGVRDTSFLAAPVFPTRLIDESGETTCFVHLLDGRPHFILDPRALVEAGRVP